MIWCFKPLGHGFLRKKKNIWKTSIGCTWPFCKRSSFYLLELSPQCLSAAPCKVMHMCQSLRQISVFGPAICIVLTSCKYFIFHLFHAKPHQCEHNVVSLQRGCCGLIIFTIWKGTSHTHVKENYCKHSLFYPSNWHANHAPPETGCTQRFSHFLVRCSQKPVTLVAHGKVSPRTNITWERGTPCRVLFEDICPSRSPRRQQPCGPCWIVWFRNGFVWK